MYQRTYYIIRPDANVAFFIEQFLNNQQVIDWIANQPGYINHTFEYNDDRSIITRILEFDTEENYNNMVDNWLLLEPTYVSNYIAYNLENDHTVIIS